MYALLNTYVSKLACGWMDGILPRSSNHQDERGGRTKMLPVMLGASLDWPGGVARD